MIRAKSFSLSNTASTILVFGPIPPGWLLAGFSYHGTVFGTGTLRAGCFGVAPKAGADFASGRPIQDSALVLVSSLSFQVIDFTVGELMTSEINYFAVQLVADAAGSLDGQIWIDLRSRHG